LFLEVSIGSELEVALTVVRLECFFAREVFSATVGLRVFVMLGEPLDPLGLRGSDAWGATLVALKLRGFIALGFLSPFCGSFTEESGSMPCGTVHKLWLLVPIKIEGIHIEELPG
jgi:hypothetical protein